MNDVNIIKAPFTEEQVASLNEYQKIGILHEFTCGGENCKKKNRQLVATTEGWICPCGEYKQDWAHEFMGNPKAIEDLKKSREEFLNPKSRPKKDIKFKDLPNCPKCGTNWDGGSIFDTFLAHRDEGREYLKGKTDGEIRNLIEESYSPPYRWSRLIGIEIQGQYDGISYWQCPDCKATWDRFAEKEVDNIPPVN